MSEKNDVLVVMRRDATDATRLRSQQDSAYARRRAAESVIAIAYVTELIEAAQAATAVVMHDGTSSREACERLDAAWRACVAANG